MRSRLALASMLLLPLVLVLAAPAGATTVGWHETAKVKKVKVMTYVVDSITMTAKGWKAHVTFANTSKATVKIGDQFGIAFYRNKGDTALNKAVGFAQATTFSSTIPKTLKPGESWSGTISGKGTLSTDVTLYERVVFGPFTGLPGEKGSVYWITDHVLPVGSTISEPPGANVA